MNGISRDDAVRSQIGPSDGGPGAHIRNDSMTSLHRSPHNSSTRRLIPPSTLVPGNTALVIAAPINTLIAGSPIAGPQAGLVGRRVKCTALSWHNTTASIWTAGLVLDIPHAPDISNTIPAQVWDATYDGSLCSGRSRTCPFPGPAPRNVPQDSSIASEPSIADA
jgi:hypothetical protein